MESLVNALSENLAALEPAGDLIDFIFCLSIAALFGIALNLLYSLYYHSNEAQDGSLARSLALLTPSLAATFWMVQSSLVLSLGLLGSLSFVRFRTPVKRAEDVSFIVVAIAVAIASAIHQFLIATTLIVMFFVYTWIRNHFSAHLTSKDRFAIITFNTHVAVTLQDISSALNELAVKPEFVSSRSYDGITSYVFNARKVDDVSHDAINRRLALMDKQAHINIFYPSDRLGA